MSTIGHPLSDLINLTTPYFLTNDNAVKHVPSFKPGNTPGLPTRDDLMRWYAEVAHWDPNPDLSWGISFGFFRSACIYQGIAARWATRQASSAKARENSLARHPMADLAWETCKIAKEQSKEKSKL